jgi:copper transport protein
VTRKLRWLLAVVVGVVTLVATPIAAFAHALPQTSDPAAGATLKEPPKDVRVTFGETPDPHLSRLRVLDSNGQDHTTGTTQPVPGDARTLQVSVGPLSNGVYTVSWRTVSLVDGHVAAGTFTFGVGVSPVGTGATGGFTAKSPSPPPAAVAAKWLLYAGLMGLLGAAFLAVVCYRSTEPHLGILVWTSWAVAALGTIGITIEERHAAGLAWSQLWGSSIGHQFLWRAVPLAAVLVVLLMLHWIRDQAAQLRALTLAGIATLVAMWGDVESSHAAAAHTFRLLRMADQWAHFAAAGIWVGGLAALLVTVAAVSPEERRRGAVRYSLAALVSVAVVGATGLQRAYDEVGTVHRLFHTAFGQYVVLKMGLLVILVGLGAVNRYRSVPALERSTRPLVRVATIELALLGAVLVATGIIQNLAPPTSAAAAAPRPLVVTGHDFGTTVRVTLAITPGTVGFNDFTTTVNDYDTHEPVDGSASLSFSAPARPDLGSSTLALNRVKAGTFSATGANMALNTPWSIVLTLQRATGGVQIPFTVTPRVPPQKIDVEPQGSGLPTLYTLHAPGNLSLQTYLDPGHAGFNELHLTFIGADGQETPTSTALVTATPPTGPAVDLTVRRLDDIGHFVADVPGAVKGTYHFHVVGTTATGTTIDGTFTIPVQ